MDVKYFNILIFITLKSKNAKTFIIKCELNKSNSPFKIGILKKYELKDCKFQLILKGFDCSCQHTNINLYFCIMQTSSKFFQKTFFGKDKTQQLQRVSQSKIQQQISPWEQNEKNFNPALNYSYKTIQSKVHRLPVSQRFIKSYKKKLIQSTQFISQTVEKISLNNQEKIYNKSLKNMSFDKKSSKIEPQPQQIIPKIKSTKKQSSISSIMNKVKQEENSQFPKLNIKQFLELQAKSKDYSDEQIMIRRKFRKKFLEEFANSKSRKKSFRQKLPKIQQRYALAIKNPELGIFGMRKSQIQS